MTTPAQSLQTLARLDPGYPAFVAALPPQAFPVTTPLPDDLLFSRER